MNECQICGCLIDERLTICCNCEGDIRERGIDNDRYIQDAYEGYIDDNKS